MARGVATDHHRLLSALHALLEGPNEEPPFTTFLQQLESQHQYAFAALYLPSLAPAAEPLLLCPSANNLSMPQPQTDYFVTYNRFDQVANRPQTLSEIEGEGFGNSPYVKHFLRPNQLADVLVLNSECFGSATARLIVGVRSSKRGFNGIDHDFFQALSHYLSQALRIYTHKAYLESCSRMHDRLISRLGIGEIRLDVHGRIVFTNTLSDRLLASSHVLTRKRNKLHCPDAHNENLLRTTLDQFLGADAVLPWQPIFLTARNHLDVVALLIRQIPVLRAETATDPPTALALYIVNSTERLGNFTEPLTKLFDFSEAEARVAAHLAHGKSAEEIGRVLHISRNTVRTHISHMYAKTGIHREATLVSILARTLSGTGLYGD